MSRRGEWGVGFRVVWLRFIVAFHSANTCHQMRLPVESGEPAPLGELP